MSRPESASFVDSARPLDAGEGGLLLLSCLLVGWAGWVLLTPTPQPARTPPQLRPRDDIPSLTLLYERIRQTPPAPQTAAWRPAALRSDWRRIAVHHSATIGGSAAAFDRYHRRKPHPMENGLAYHFVIGNGNGTADGQVEIGERWIKQLDGGHVRGDKLNAESIGICLVGDFEHYLPTERQIASLKALLNALLNITGMDDAVIEGHRALPDQQTVCPGRYLPVSEVVRHRETPSD